MQYIYFNLTVFKKKTNSLPWQTYFFVSCCKQYIQAGTLIFQILTEKSFIHSIKLCTYLTHAISVVPVTIRHWPNISILSAFMKERAAL